MLDMNLDRSNAQRERRGDLTIGLSIDNQRKHLALAPRQILQLRCAGYRWLAGELLKCMRRPVTAENRFAA